ncbi:MAG: hypothetical protein KKA79_00420 [Nanoarchaeota archaeon]|nr:hypothetical protein [Nanoarchaeota archaeon]
MKPRLKKLAMGATGLLFAASLLGGCAPPYKQHVRNIATEKGYTSEQAEVIYHGILVKEIMAVNEDGTRTINYDWASNQDILLKIKDMKDDIEAILNDTNPKTVKMLDEFGDMKESIEKNGKIVKFMEDVVKTHHLKEKFDGNMESYWYDEKSDKFDAKIFKPGKDLEEKLKFTAKYVEEAKAMGNLKVIENFKLEFDYKEKHPDPNYPGDKNKAVYKDKRLALRVKVFDTGEDNVGDYVELYRVRPDGTDEDKPAVKIFSSMDNDKVNLMVVDKDDELMGPGYGLPDIVERIWGINDEQIAMQLFQNKALLAQIFEKIEKKKMPEQRDNEVFITKAGKVEVPEYEISKAPEGWKVPMTYKDKTDLNYTLELIFAENEVTEDMKPKEAMLKQIKYIAKKYHSATSAYSPVKGKVVEYYEPKAEYANNNILNAEVSGKKMTLDLVGQETKTAFNNYFTEMEPVAIDFTSRDIRYRIVDLDGKPGHEARKKISKNGGMASMKKATVSDYGDMLYGPYDKDIDPVGE